MSTHTAMSNNPVPESTEPIVIPLWPDGAPGSQDWNWREEESVAPQTGMRVVHNVVQPTLTVYLPDRTAASPVTAVVICPGGGWHYLEIEKEGTDMARWLNARGVAAFVLKYRLLHTSGDFLTEVRQNLADRSRLAAMLKPLVPLVIADGQQAMRLVRRRAAEWSIAPGRIGITGFSAGGMVAANVALLHDESSRPDFVMPIYSAPVLDVPVPPDAPPMFLTVAHDDSLVDVSLRLYSVWKQAGRSAELHIYAQGGHGFGLRPHGQPADTWMDRMADWMKSLSLL